jgi:hypothetical protein
VGSDIVAGCVAQPHTYDFIRFAVLPQACDESRPHRYDTTQQKADVEDAGAEQGSACAKKKAIDKAAKLSSEKKVGL